MTPKLGKVESERAMPPQRPLPNNDDDVTFSYVTPVQQFGDAVLLGQWFVFIKPDWLQRTGFEQLLTCVELGAGVPRSRCEYRSAWGPHRRTRYTCFYLSFLSADISSFPIIFTEHGSKCREILHQPLHHVTPASQLQTVLEGC